MPILDIQRRARELGRIRLGQQQAFTRSNGSTGTKPVKLDRFRLTSASKPLLDKVAELYGGDVAEWTPPGGSPQWEVITSSARLPIMVPPQPVTQWYEFWTRAGCQHRCDGQHNVITDEPCDPNEQLTVGQNTVNPHAEALKKPTTRLNVVLRDVEGIGVWRVETHGWNAALELPDVAEFLAQAGGYVNGWLALEQRTSVGRNERTGQPETRHFMVPIIEIDVTPAQLMAGHGRVAAPALTGGPVNSAPALAAAGPDYVAFAAEATDAEQVRNIWRQARDAGHMTAGLNDHLTKRARELPEPGNQPAAVEAPAQPDEHQHQEQHAEPQSSPSTPAGPTPTEEDPVEAELVPEEPTHPAEPAVDADPALDADAIWSQIVTEAGRQGMTSADVQDHFAQVMQGLTADSASAAELAHYLTQLQTGHAA